MSLGALCPQSPMAPSSARWVPAAACGRRPTLLMQIRSTKGPLWAPQPTELLCNGRAAPGGEEKALGTARPSPRHGTGTAGSEHKNLAFSARFLRFRLSAPQALLHLQHRLLNRYKVCTVLRAGSALPATRPTPGLRKDPKPETRSASRGHVCPTPQGRHLRLIINRAPMAPSHSLPRCGGHAALKPNSC